MLAEPVRRSPQGACERHGADRLARRVSRISTSLPRQRTDRPIHPQGVRPNDRAVMERNPNYFRQADRIWTGSSCAFFRTRQRSRGPAEPGNRCDRGSESEPFKRVAAIRGVKAFQVTGGTFNNIVLYAILPPFDDPKARMALRLRHGPPCRWRKPSPAGRAPRRRPSDLRGLRVLRQGDADPQAGPRRRRASCSRRPATSTGSNTARRVE